MNKADRNLLYAGAAGLLLAALGWLLDSGRFYGGWLAAFTLLGGWSLGSMALLLIHALTGGRWGDALRPALRIGVCALPLLVPAFLPLLPGLAHLYPWARPGADFGNRFYLNMPFFAGRGAFYLLAWFILGWLTLRTRRLELIAPFGLVLLALTATFAAIDLTMSLEPDFVSSIYGMLAASGMALLALSAAVLLTAGETRTETRADFGRLLMALVVLWIYLDFMQLLIVWQSNLTSEAPWYIGRSRGFWGAVRAVIAVGHFVLPFFLLMSPRIQRSRRAVMLIAGLLVAMEVLRAWWTVLPALGFVVGWIDVACIVGLGGVAVVFAPWAARRPLFAQARPLSTESRNA